MCVYTYILIYLYTICVDVIDNDVALRLVSQLGAVLEQQARVYSEMVPLLVREVVFQILFMKMA